MADHVLDQPANACYCHYEVWQSMTNSGDVIHNPVTGMSVTIIKTAADTEGRETVIEYSLPPFAGRKATTPHRHRRYIERFEILAGRAGFVSGSREGAADVGDVIEVPRETTHVHPWSISDEPLRVRQTTEAITPDEPGLSAALEAVKTNFALAQAGKVDADGRPSLLQAAMLLDALLPDNYLAGIPLAAQRVIFGGLAALGRLRGYRPA